MIATRSRGSLRVRGQGRGRLAYSPDPEANVADNCNTDLSLEDTLPEGPDAAYQLRRSARNHQRVID